jgi:hypothetical protein
VWGALQREYPLALRLIGDALAEAPDSEHLNLVKAEVRVEGGPRSPAAGLHPLLCARALLEG